MLGNDAPASQTPTSRSYRHSGYGGTELFFIGDDPNALSFQRRVAFKVVWAL